MAESELTFSNAAKQAPPQAWFAISAIFHYLGPSFAVLLFPSVGVLGVAWMRIGAAAAIFAPWTTPWRTLAKADGQTRHRRSRWRLSSRADHRLAEPAERTFARAARRLVPAQN
jgi:hypothetical protein